MFRVKVSHRLFVNKSSKLTRHGELVEPYSEMKNMYVYILLCSDNSYYTGVTNDVEGRFKEHQDGFVNECYTYARRPLQLKFYELFNTPQEAIKFEKQIKKWSRAKKEALIERNWEKLKLLSKSKNGSTSSP
ncbi:MAG: hypothetical protein RL708_1669 [Bacteroidota bacterium]